MKILTSKCLQCNKGLVEAENKGNTDWKIIWCSNMDCQNSLIGQGKTQADAIKDYNERYERIYGI